MSHGGAATEIVTRPPVGLSPRSSFCVCWGCCGCVALEGMPPTGNPPGGRPLTVVYIALPGVGFRVCVIVPVFFPVGAGVLVDVDMPIGVDTPVDVGIGISVVGISVDLGIPPNGVYRAVV
jgi:hypothetical protein